MAKIIKNAANIAINFTLTGNGVVNRNGINGWQEYNATHRGAGVNPGKKICSLAKANVYKVGTETDAEGKQRDILVRRLIISDNCLRHSLFEDNAVAFTPGTIYSKSELLNYISHPDSILRGYLVATKKSTMKRKSPLTIPSAEISNGAETSMQVITASGPRCDTSLCEKETIGRTEYKATIRINLAELQFISLGTIFDRSAVSPDLQAAFIDTLFKNGMIAEGKAGYRIPTATNQQGELGIKLTDEAVTSLVQNLLNKMVNLSIERAGAFAEFDSVDSITIKYGDGSRETFDNDFLAELLDPKTKIVTKEKYVKVSLEDAEKADAETQKYIDEHNSEAKKAAEKAAKKAAKKAKDGDTQADPE